MKLNTLSNERQKTADVIVVVALIVPFIILNPILLLVHGFFWNFGGLNTAILVYGMKITPLFFLAGAVFSLGVRDAIGAFANKPAAILAVVCLISLVTPLIFGTEPQLFYYFADAAGFISTVSYAGVTTQLIKRNPSLIGLIFRVMISGAAVTSVVIVALYFITAGEKVSIPPDVHYGIALSVVLYLTSSAKGLNLKLSPILIAAGVGAAMLRMNILIGVLSIFAAWFWQLIFNRKKISAWRAVETAILLAVMALLFSQPLMSTLSRATLVAWYPPDAIAKIWAGSPILGSIPDRDLEGAAVDQRYVESLLVFEELQAAPASFLVGKGFGATFENTDGVLSGHDAREHSIHNSIFALLLRNGLMGVLLFLTPAGLAVWTCFRGDRRLFVASVGLLSIYLACMADQYVYWGGYFGIALAVWYTCWRLPSNQQVEDHP